MAWNQQSWQWWGQWQQFETMMEELQQKCEWLRVKVDEQSDEMKRLSTQVALLEQANKDLRQRPYEHSLRHHPEAKARPGGTSRGGPCQTCYGGIVLDLEKEQALFEKGTKHWRDIEKKLRREGRFLAWGATGKSQRVSMR